MRTRRLAAPLALLLTLGGCLWPSGLDDRPSFPVRGRVTRASGEPVSGAVVVVNARLDACTAPIYSTSSATTNAQGQYSSDFIAEETTFAGCVEVQVGSLAGSATARAADVTLQAGEVTTLDVVIGATSSATRAR